MSNTLDILVHVPRLSEAILVTIAPDATIIALEEHLRANGHVEATFSEVFVFKEGVLVALDRGVTLLDHGIAHGEHVHIHHRKEIAVSVHYMDGCIERPFSPHESVGNVDAALRS